MNDQAPILTRVGPYLTIALGLAIAVAFIGGGYLLKWVGEPHEPESIVYEIRVTEWPRISIP